MEEVLDCYFKACSIKVTCKDLARIAYVFASRGKMPITEARIFPAEYAHFVNAVLVTCGMYDGSGEFAIRVGIPAKSGGGGGILCCVEDNFGIAVYGPSLDAKGNSVWGLKILEYLSKQLNLHYFSGSKVKEYI